MGNQPYFPSFHLSAHQEALRQRALQQRDVARKMWFAKLEEIDASETAKSKIDQNAKARVVIQKVVAQEMKPLVSKPETEILCELSREDCEVAFDWLCRCQQALKFSNNYKDFQNLIVEGKQLIEFMEYTSSLDEPIDDLSHTTSSGAQFTVGPSIVINYWDIIVREKQLREIHFNKNQK